MLIRTKGLLRTSCLVVLIFVIFVAGPAAVAQTTGKIPLEVIDQAASHGTALVLVGLNVPWQMESRLSDEAVRSQRKAIASIQRELLNELAGRNYKVIRRYEEVPGIALEVGADALAELARSAIVTNVLLDRPAADPAKDGEQASGQASGKTMESLPSEKIPPQLFKRVASGGTVLVLAGLRAPWQQENQLSEELIALQRRAILDAQSYVLAELAGTQFRVMRLYREIPGIALRVGLDALKVLERSPAVTNVLPDRPARSSP